MESVSHLFLFFSYEDSWHIKYKFQLFCSYYWPVNITMLFKLSVTVTFLVAVTKRFTRRVYLSLKLKGLPPMAEKHRERLEHEVANHIASVGRKKKANRWAHTLQPQSLPEAPHFLQGGSTS